MAHHIAGLVPRSHTAVLWRDPYFDFEYDTELPRTKRPVIAEFLHGLLGPIILGRLLNRAQGFLYLGQLGFLPISDRNYREFEFRFIKSRGRALACYFVGSDIRSPVLMRELAERTGLANLGNHLGAANPIFDTQTYDDSKRRIAAVADSFADVVFSASVDQLSYLQRPTHPITYFYPDEKFFSDESKFDSLERPVIVHAPSNPVIKGTSLVRSAIERLRSEGYNFEYVELAGVGNDVVRSELRRAHIALNQFYAFIPGVFGIEALASGCAVLMSSDETIEPDLPVGSNQAWVVTRYDEVYGNLKRLLDEPALLLPQARRGREWALENVSFSHAGPRLRSVLDQALRESRAADLWPSITT